MALAALRGDVPPPAQVDKILDYLSEGDIITTRRTWRVEKRCGPNAILRDVQDDMPYHLFRDAGHGSLRIDMVKKVAKPKPKAGETITAEQLRETMWKAGTTIRYRTVSMEPSRTIIAVLQKDGEWQATASDGGTWKWSFDAPFSVTRYELLHVA